jgi:integral membrane protein (TIGR01906 family)
LALPAFSMGYYSRQYDRLNIPENIGIEKDELMTVTKHLTDYMRGKEPELVVYARINGEEREFFSQLDKDHMVDVKNLFTMGFAVFYTALLLFFVTSIVTVYRKRLLLQVKCYMYAAAGVLAFSLILIGIIALDFEKAFVVFHEIFFNNDLWLLDPDDLLVNIVPEQFFINISQRIGITFASSLAFTAAGGWLLIRLKKPNAEG